MGYFTSFFVLSLGNPHVFYTITAHPRLDQSILSAQLSRMRDVLAGDPGPASVPLPLACPHCSEEAAEAQCGAITPSKATQQSQELNTHLSYSQPHVLLPVFKFFLAVGLFLKKEQSTMANLAGSHGARWGVSFIPSAKAWALRRRFTQPEAIRGGFPEEVWPPQPLVAGRWS